MELGSRAVHVIEELPCEGPRWACRWGGPDSDAFDDLDRAVAWGLARAETVVVRTLGGLSFVVGETTDGSGAETRRWPPHGTERAAIDETYEAEVASARAEELARSTYEQEHDRWIGVHVPRLAGREPVHAATILVDPETNPIDFIEFDELSEDAAVCGARRFGTSRYAFGESRDLLANMSDRSVDDPWIDAVVAALDRERNWEGFGRRRDLTVTFGVGEMFHATSVVNRESIRTYGLDWTRMNAAAGIAGSRGPELAAIFLCESLDEAGFFTNMGRGLSDVWAVNVEGLWVESGPHGWWIVPEPINPGRLRLAGIDIASRRPMRH